MLYRQRCTGQAERTSQTRLSQIACLLLAFVVMLFTAGCGLPFVQKSPEQELREELSNNPETRLERETCVLNHKNTKMVFDKVEAI